MLLWHGSRITNFVGILSQGLRIAPPEAPVSGYLFGKGIYLADMAEKSINYCRSHGSQKALILLIQVFLLIYSGSYWHSKYFAHFFLSSERIDGAKWQTLHKMSWSKSTPIIKLCIHEKYDCAERPCKTYRLRVIHGP